MGLFRPLFLYVRLFNTIDKRLTNVLFKNWLMTGFEPRTSGVASDRSTNRATTTTSRH